MKFCPLLFAIFFLFMAKALSNDVIGTDFIATFIPNYHNNSNSPDNQMKYGDSVYLFIYADKVANVNIEYNNQLGQHFVDNFKVSANTIYTFKKTSYDYALLGYNKSGTIKNRNNSEMTSNISFRVKSDSPIMVYGHSQAVKSSESFNVMPVQALGNDYIVAAYNSSNYNNTGFANGSTPSQFAIVATEDNTQVDILPSVATKYNGTKNQAIKLNKNEVYLVQADITPTLEYADLTGSSVKSNKPIAIFGGHQRAAVPYNIKGSAVSRDYLVEQIPTLETWSLSTYVIPFPQPSAIATTIDDIFRVIAGFDNTDIFIDDIYYGTLNKGKFFELPLDKAYKVRGSSPILAIAYKRSSQTSTADYSLGDPLMQIVPSIDQYGNSYKFINIQAYEFNGWDYSPVYEEHFIALIVHSNSLNTIKLDGATITTNGFKKIEGTDYYYGYKKVTDGVHTISATDNFGLFICGYGEANSYGYFSGILTKRDDYEPPTFQTVTDNCFILNGKIEDKRIAEASYDKSKTQNLKVEIDTFKPYVKELNFRAELINKKQDGQTRIIAKDSIGQQNYKDIKIAGFTIGITQSPIIEQTEPIIIEDILLLNEKKCYEYTIKNYGSHDQIITKASLRFATDLTCNLPAKFTLKPGESKNFSVCITPTSGDSYIDTLFIEDACNKQDFIVFNLLSKKDDKEPVLTSSKDKCNNSIFITISDSSRIDRGIKQVIIEQQTNIKINEIYKSKSVINLDAKVIDPYKDAFISITAIDSVGLSVNYKDTIPGFTIAINSIRDSSNILNFDTTKIGLVYCKEITLTNYGMFPITLDDIYLNQNIYFSIPLSQLPLIISPNESKNLEVCLKSYTASTNRIFDTLHIPFNCLDKAFLMESVSDSLIFDNKSKCEVNLVFSSGEIENSNNVGALYPNPTKTEINFVMKIKENAHIIGKIYNNLGQEVSQYLNSNFNNGVFEVNVNIEKLGNGVYYNIVSINNEIFSTIFTINK
ncbi:MAG TPA: hypothetical protein PLE30_03480 [Candidatus Kapabacteria bacterium]|nr:hypothetical protein [Candidatus Kapabacteria bacterium]